jgi:hypothetical protein
MNLVPSNTPPASTELAELVDRYLDQRLDEAAGRRFEELLNEDPQARTYCAERIRLHAELGAQARPLRIEIFEGRQLVIEQTGEVSTVEVRSTGQVTVAPATGALALAGPSAGKNRRKTKFLWAAAGIGAAALLSAAIWIAVRSRPAPAGNTGPGLLALRPLENASFETPELSDGETTTTPAGWKLDIPHFAWSSTPPPTRRTTATAAPTCRAPKTKSTVPTCSPCAAPTTPPTLPAAATVGRNSGSRDARAPDSKWSNSAIWTAEPSG